MASVKKFNYSNITFADARNELFSFITENYPEVLADFNDSSIGTALLELNAASIDILSNLIDRRAQENQLEYAQERKSILMHAKTLGLNIPGKRASVTVVSFSFKVPVKGDSFDTDYLPIIKPGTQVTGGGKIFENIDDIDFSSPFSAFGIPNRSVIPNINANDIIESYTITKQEVVFNGQTKIFKKVISAKDVKPFATLFLPENNVLSVEQIILLPGTNYNVDPDISKFYDDTVRYYEVDYLVQPRIFKHNTSLANTDNLKSGTWLDVKKRFIKEFTDKGFCKLTFGGGNGDYNLFESAFESQKTFNPLRSYIENTALGETLKENYTLFVRYRIGGGSGSNLGPNILTNVGQRNIYVQGPKEDVNNLVIRSFSVNNVIPALGGVDAPSTEQIRNLIKYNFAAQYRCVTLNDYLLMTYRMPGQFGSPFRVNTHKENNKVVIPIIGLDEKGQLNNSSTSILKENISEWLAESRMFNDYVQVTDGRIYHLACDFDLYVGQDFSKSQIANQAILKVIDYFNIDKRVMNEDVFIGDIIETLNNIDGVINVINYKFYNMVGNGYSINAIEMAYADATTKEIQLVNNTIYSSKDSMFEIKFPNSDIRIRLKKKNEL
jgi:hypothetical protein